MSSARGLAGLSAAVALAGRGVPSSLSEAARQAGGRCRSYHDGLLDMTIDNGNHLVLSGNGAVDRYLRDIGARGQAHRARPARSSTSSISNWAALDAAARTTDPCPGGFSMPTRRVPGTRARDYLALLTLMRRHPGRRIGEVVRRDTVLWEKFLRPVLLSALNTAPEEASADLAGAIVRETLAKGGRHMRAAHRLAQVWPPPSSIPPSIACAAHGADIRLGRPLRAVRFADGTGGRRWPSTSEDETRGRGGSRDPGGAALGRPEVAAGH